MTDVSQIDTAALLKPFLAVVRSSSTTGAITSLALNSISKFFSYQLINSESPNLSEAMRILSSAVTHCRFEASDSGQQDEMVLLRILMLMQEMLCGVGGDLLSDESVCEMMETGLSMCCQMRLSEMLRRSAEMSMLKMVQIMFTRLKQLESDESEEVPSLPVVQTPVGSPKTRPIDSPSKTKARMTDEKVLGTNGAKTSEDAASNGVPSEDIEPYGITSIRELLRVLISILNPAQRQHTDSMRVMALRIIEVAFEIGGQAIAIRPSLRKLATDDLCRYLFQLVRSDNHIVLQSSLHVIQTLLHTMRGHLKLQQELFLNYVVACLVPRADALRESGLDPSIYEALPIAPRVMTLTSGRSTPVPIRDRQRLGLEGGSRGADAREVMIECIGSLIRIPSFMTDLFVNYDCDENLSDLCEDVLGFLCRNAFPDAAAWSTTYVPPLCLDALLGYISLVDSRLELTTEQPSPGMPDPARLSESRRRKELIVRSAAKFNEDPKTGVQFLKENNVIDAENDTSSLALFLFSCGRINKQLLGDYISKPKNIALLQAFIKLFDLRGKRIDEALRELLQKFRLPGEAQLISRIVEEFAIIYVGAGSTDFGNSDAAFVLAYAIIMLNTDQHNPQAKKARMTPQDFSRNLRGTNNGEDFRAEYLQEIYDEIKNNEIIMPEEHDTSASFDQAWKELQNRVGTAGPLAICETNIYDEAMFRATWKPLVATLSFVFQSATDDAVFSRVIGGLSQCARIAARYGITEVMDQIVSSLAKMTLLDGDQLPSIEGNTMVEVDAQKVTVSELGIAFGREFKAQLAMVILFRICNGNERIIRSGWTHLFNVFSALLVNSLLPVSFSPLHQFMKISPIPLPPPNRSSKVVLRNQEAGFFSSLSSYLSSYASDELPQPTSDDIESTMCTFDCVNSCHLDTVASNLLSLEIDEAEYLVEQLIEEAKEDTAAKKAVSALLSQSQTKGQAFPNYDPAELLKVEVATALALKDAQHTQRFGERVLQRLHKILQNAPGNHSLMSERAMSYSLRLYQAVVELDLDAQPDLISQYAALDETILKATSIATAYGLLGVLRVDSAVPRIARKQETFELLRKIQSNPDAASLLFEIVSLLSGAVDSNNFIQVVGMLNDFSTAGQIGAQDERQALIAKKRAQDKKSPRKAEAKPTVTHRDEIQRACRAIELMYQLRQDCAEIAKRSDEPSTVWSALICSLRDQCLNPCKEVGKCAFTHLQRLFLALDLSTNNPTPSVVFDDGIIPLLETLQDPKTKVKVNEDNKVQASSLLCKVWLHHLSSIQTREDATAQWTRVLSALIKLMTTAQSPYLTEAIPESIKNVLLVMASTEMLVKGNEMFQETSRILHDANLSTMEDLFGSDEDVEETKQEVVEDEKLEQSADEEETTTNGSEVQNQTDQSIVEAGTDGQSVA